MYQIHDPVNVLFCALLIVLSRNKTDAVIKKTWVYWCYLVLSRQLEEEGRGGSRTAATSKMEHFVIIVNGWKPLTIITKSSILYVASVLDPPLEGMDVPNHSFLLVMSFIIVLFYFMKFFFTECTFDFSKIKIKIIRFVSTTLFYIFSVLVKNIAPPTLLTGKTFEILKFSMAWLIFYIFALFIYWLSKNS